MPQTNSKKEIAPPTQVRLVVEVDGNPIGFLSLDLDRLWPLINHHKRDAVPVEWMDPSKFESIMRATVVKKLLSRLEGRLYQTLGDEMVKAELDVESFILKADAAAQLFGRSKPEIEKLVAESGRSTTDFYNFFCEFLLDDREVTDLKKEWKSREIPPR
jgi:hypothetical protein